MQNSKIRSRDADTAEKEAAGSPRGPETAVNAGNETRVGGDRGAGARKLGYRVPTEATRTRRTLTATAAADVLPASFGHTAWCSRANSKPIQMGGFFAKNV